MKEELQYKNGFERQTKLHGSDSLITVDELWKSWKFSEGLLNKLKNYQKIFFK